MESAVTTMVTADFLLFLIFRQGDNEACTSKIK